MEKHISSSWRKFEKLVALIEASLSPKGAMVKSPDHLLDKITGELREVDASIKFKIGSVDIFIIVECRERSKKQDVTWIEQLAVKQKNIGASKVIAVTAKGLSKPAMLKAAFYDIEVRHLEKITFESIHKWIDFVYRDYRHVNYDFVTDAQLKNDKDISKLIVFDKDGREKLVDDILYSLWGFAIKNRIAPKSNSSKQTVQFYKLPMYLPKQRYFFKTDKGLFEWFAVIFNFTLEVTTKNIERDMFAYASENDIFALVYNFELPDLGDREPFHVANELVKLKKKPK